VQDGREGIGLGGARGPRGEPDRQDQEGQYARDAEGQGLVSRSVTAIASFPSRGIITGPPFASI